MSQVEFQTMKKILIILSAAVLCGCATKPQPYKVKLDSEPQGARVFLALNSHPESQYQIREDIDSLGGRNYLGVTPCTVEIQGTSSGDFIIPRIAKVSKYVSGSAVFIADPPSGSNNLFSQVVIFRGQSKYVDGDKIPNGVFFDMHKPH